MKFAMVLAFILLVLLMGIRAGKGAATKTCSIKRYGRLTTFTGESASLEIPCAYSMTVMRCGDYNVSVGAASEQEADSAHFSPVKMFVDVAKGTPEAWSWSVHASDLDKAKSDDGTHQVFPDINVDDTSVHSSYDLERKAAVVFAKSKTDGRPVFEVVFRDIVNHDKEAGVEVSCRDESFSASSYPPSVCGDGITANALIQRKGEIFGGAGYRGHALTHDVLMTQSDKDDKECQALRSMFLNECDKKRKHATLTCNPILADQRVGKCLMRNKSTSDILAVFSSCVEAMCGAEGAAACQTLKDYLGQMDPQCQEFASGRLSGLRC